MSSMKTYKRLLTYLKPYMGLFFIALFSMSIFGATDGFIPFLLKKVLDDVFGNKDPHVLWWVVGCLVVFSIVRGLFGFLEKYMSAKVGHSIVRDIRNQLFSKFVTAPIPFIEESGSGGLISRVTNDALLVRTALTEAGASLLRDTVRIIALLTVAVYLDPFMALMAFVGFPLCILPVIKFGKRVKKLSRSGQEQFGDITGLLGQVISGAKVVRIFGRENFEKDRFAKENEKFTSVLLKAEKYGALSSPTNEVLATLAVAAVMVYGALSVIKGVRTQGDFIAFITSVFLLYEPFKKLSRVTTSIQTGLSAAERIFEVIDAPEEIKDQGSKILDANIKSIDYRNVSFAYKQDVLETANRNAVSDLDFSITSGQTIAIVGMSGSGKTTIANLLPRFYDVSSGGIFINDIDIRQYTLESLRSQMSLVSQHIILFDDTVYNNISYGKEGATREQIEEAAKKAYAYDFIVNLPQGFDTQVGEQGMKLSGGQRARLAIARALLKDAPILILDEATASLDNDSEEQVQKAIDELMVGRTVIVIAHRLSTIKNANKILVMKEGRKIEFGTHDDLLLGNDMGGEYSRLYAIQFKE